MKCSVVIPTLNRPEAVTGLVEQILRQDFHDKEIIIVDQSPEVNIDLERLDATRNDVRYLRREKPSTTAARNMGWKTAQGEIIVFFDDDTDLLDAHVLSQHIKNYENENIGGVGGRVKDDQALNKIDGGPVCAVTWTGVIHPNADSDMRQPISAPRGGNMSFRRKVIEEVGGFDERFRGNAMREETDFSLRVVRAGHIIMFDPLAAVAHRTLLYGGSRDKDRISWYEDFFFNETLFFVKHFPLTLFPLLLLRKTRPIIACMVYYGKGRPRALRAPWKGITHGWKAARIPLQKD
ncbi:MAG: glycosyltransferase [Patescibacteria group bacterium]|jgi:GT2 family glycosyltransferase